MSLFDPSASQGFGNYPWVIIVVWSVSTTSALVSAQNLSAITALLNTNYAGTSQVAIVPNSYLTLGGIYTFSLTVINFWSEVGVVVVTV